MFIIIISKIAKVNYNSILIIYYFMISISNLYRRKKVFSGFFLLCVKTTQRNRFDDNFVSDTWWRLANLLIIKQLFKNGLVCWFQREHYLICLRALCTSLTKRKSNWGYEKFPCKNKIILIVHISLIGGDNCAILVLWFSPKIIWFLSTEN